MAVKRSNDFVLREPVQLSEVTDEDLMVSDGSDPSRSMMVIKGQIYYVSRSMYLYSWKSFEEAMGSIEKAKSVNDKS